MSEQSREFKFMGGALMAVGGLIAALCGTCTAVWVGAIVFEAVRLGSGAGLPWMGLGLAIGGLPTLIGVALARWGWRIYRPVRRVRSRALADFSDEPAP